MTTPKPAPKPIPAPDPIDPHSVEGFDALDSEQLAAAEEALTRSKAHRSASRDLALAEAVSSLMVTGPHALLR